MLLFRRPPPAPGIRKSPGAVSSKWMQAIVYTETTVYAPPESLAAEAPYQLAIVEFADGSRRTVRIAGPAVSIGDEVSLVEERGGVAFFQRT